MDTAVAFPLKTRDRTIVVTAKGPIPIPTPANANGAPGTDPECNCAG